MTTAKKGIDQLCASIQKTHCSQLRVQLSGWREFSTVDIADWNNLYSGGSYCKLQSGVSIEISLIDELIDGLQKARDAAVSAGLLKSARRDGPGRPKEKGHG